MRSNYKCTFGLKEDKSTSVTQKQMPSQREQYMNTVRLFIGVGHSSYKITPMPFTFDSNSIVIHRGSNSLFIFKSVSFPATMPKLFCLQLRRCTSLRIFLSFSLYDPDSSPKIPVCTLYSRNTVKSCFWGPSEAEGPQQQWGLRAKIYPVLVLDAKGGENKAKARNGSATTWEFWK
jgi:hypothetical protein